MKMNLKSVCFALLMIFVSHCIGAQSNDVSAIKSLSNGVLVVRLDMQKNKIEAYKTSVASGKLKAKDAERMQSNLAEIENERKAYKENVMKAFTENYSFSKIAFIENDEFKAFRLGNLVNIDADEETKKQLSSGENIFYLIKGRTDAQWIIVDQDFKRPSSPFPNAFGIGLNRILNLFTGKKDHFIENQEHLAKKINKKLTKFYNKHS